MCRKIRHDGRRIAGLGLTGDVAPKNSVSIVAGLQNTVSNMGGAVGPIITGAIVAATGSFNWALIFSAILVVIGIINYLFLMGKLNLSMTKVENHPSLMPQNNIKSNPPGRGRHRA